ncbi:immunoglobulin-like domain-containing protein [Metasolibacillus meyeri]|uniref:immunoglobulin-like domain-containing protein n=1 Tax=Metasolibacillus meyeri TaxID=1071052 RepID=UPI000D2FAC70|nr:immunoglobulin-like domain-containing protein [Metasolibacillus meyeri]
MRRIFIVLVVIGLAVVGCSQEPKGQSGELIRDWEPTKYETVNNLDGVMMIVKKGTASVIGLTVIIENNSDKEITYGVDFLLEKKIKEKWYQVPFAIGGNHAFADIGYSLASFSVREWKIDWSGLYGSLNRGEYRLVKEISNFRNTDDYDNYHLAVEFTVE